VVSDTTRSKEPIQSKKPWKYTTIIALRVHFTPKLVWRTKESLLYYSLKSSYGKSSVYTDIKIRRRSLNTRRLITDKINIFRMGRDVWNVPHTETPKQNTSPKTAALLRCLRYCHCSSTRLSCMCVCGLVCVSELSCHNQSINPHIHRPLVGESRDDGQ